MINQRDLDSFAGALLFATALAVLLVLVIFVTPFALILGLAYIGYRLLRDSPRRAERLARAETMTLYNHAVAGSVRLSDEEIDRELSSALPGGLPFPIWNVLTQIGRALFEEENLTPDIPPPPALCNTIEGARYRDMIARAGQAANDRNMQLTALRTISDALAAVAIHAPRIEGDVTVPIRQFVPRPGETVAAVIAPFFAENGYGHFKALRDRLNANVAATRRTQPIYPEEYKGEDVVAAYLSGTPLAALFDAPAPFGIPEATRFEHTHIVAGSGHGKTQTLQFMIARDLEEVATGEKSVVVIDSQGDLIRNILAARTVDPDRIILIDPEDIAYPVCLNLFSVGQERLSGYEALERERLTNSIIELYDFVLGSLLSAGMTQKQSVVFRYVTRLLFHIPNATIHTLRDILEPGGIDAYRTELVALEGTARRFFEAEFDGKEFEQTKRQVLRRLYGILENQTFERMFSHPRSKLDLFSEINAGKLILINTAKSLLKEEGTEIFGRFFIALLAQAAQERATIPPEERTPTLVYIDEAQDYFDANVGLILAQARKYNIGMVLAHQYLGQLESKLQEGFEANTSIKLAGGVSARDARPLSRQMGCDAETIMRQPKGGFATFVRGLTERAVPVRFPFFVLENLPRASREEQDAVRAQSRARYAEPMRRPAERRGPEPAESVEPERDPPPEEEPVEGGGEGAKPPSASAGSPQKANPPQRKTDPSKGGRAEGGEKPIGTGDDW